MKLGYSGILQGFTLVTISLLLPFATQAQSVSGMAVTNKGEDYVQEIAYSLEQPFGGTINIESLAQYIQLIYQFSLGIIGIIAVTLIMFGGLRWVAAAGNESTIGEAKEIISSAVIGLLIALLSYTILLTINPKIITSGMTIPKIPIPLTNTTSIACAVNTISEPTGARTCKTSGTTVTATDLNGWIDKYKGSVNPSFIKGIMKTESGFCIDAKSNISGDTGMRHACGLMQVMPTTAASYAAKCGVPACAGVTSDVETDAGAIACCNALITSPEQAVCVGASHLNSLQANSYTNGDYSLIAAAYNGGTCNSSKTNGALCPSKSCTGQLMYQCEKNTGYAETRNYVKKVEENTNKMCAENVKTANPCRSKSTDPLTAADYACKQHGADVYTFARCGVDIGTGVNTKQATCASGWDVISVGCADPQFVNFNGSNETNGQFDAAPKCGLSCTTTTCGI